jgi:TolC family type I secretion outer membrane protein
MMPMRGGTHIYGLARTALVVAGLVTGLAMAAVQSVNDAHGQSLDALIPDLIKQHDRIAAAKADVRASQNRAREALGDWFPVLEPTLSHGYENIKTPHDSETGLPFSELDLSLTQLLWDFGATNASVEKARLELNETRTKLRGAEEDLLQEAVEAYVNLYRASKVLEFARRSKDNIRKQTGLEEARVETGGGLSTDVLQAKRQLAGADAREIGSEGTLITSRNRYRALFDTSPDQERMQPVRLPVELLPGDLQSAIQRAEKNNNDLVLDRLAATIARKDVHNTYGSEFFPKVEGIIEQKWKNNVSGTVDLKKEFTAKVEMSLPINLGLTAVNTLRAAQLDVVSKTRNVADTRRRIVEEVRNAWQDLHTAQATAASRRNQADIAAAFLELAREERKLGQRSLIDVLTGETELINAQSDAESANSDVTIAAYKLLNVTGDLTVGVFSTALATPNARPKPNPKPAAASAVKPETAPLPATEDETDPLAPYIPSPEMVPDGELTREAILPFANFFNDVRSVFEDTFEESQPKAPAATQKPTSK